MAAVRADHGETNPILKAAGQLVDVLTRPPAHIGERERRLQLRLLAGMLLTLAVLIGINSLRLLVTSLQTNAPQNLLSGWAVTAALLGLYALSRWGYYRGPALLLLAIGYGFTAVSPFGEGGNPTLLYYVVVTILFSGIFFRSQAVLWMSALCLVTVLALTALFPVAAARTYSAATIMGDSLFHIICGALVIGVYVSFRNRVEHFHREDLQSALLAAQAAEAKWRAIVANAPVTITYAAPDGRVEYVNREGAGQPRAGQSYLDSLPAEQRASVSAAIADALAQRSSTGFSLTVTQPDGRTAWHETQVGVVELDGQVSGLAFITSDVSERMRAAAEQARLHEQVIAAQREALKELSTPVIPVWQGVVVMPLVGSIDTQRARDITRALLGAISGHRAQVAILDLTGVPVVDTGVANHLSQTIQAARLKGASAIVCGVSDAVAEAIVDLGIDWGHIATVRDLQSALHLAQDRLAHQAGGSLGAVAAADDLLPLAD